MSVIMSTTKRKKKEKKDWQLELCLSDFPPVTSPRAQRCGLSVFPFSTTKLQQVLVSSELGLCPQLAPSLSLEYLK